MSNEWKNVYTGLYFNSYTLDIIFDDTLVSKELHIFFQNAGKTLNINESSYIVHYCSSITDPADKAMNTCKSHPNILLMKEKLENMDHFSFKEASKI